MRRTQVKDLLEAGAIRPLRAIVANAGVSVADTHSASADGYELTFAVNYLAHAQLIGDLLGSLVAPARIVLLGSNTYHQNIFRRLLKVAPAIWRDPLELARPTAPDQPATLELSRDRLLELQARDPLLRARIATSGASGINVAVFEPGFMPGTGLSRGHGPGLQRMGPDHRTDPRRLVTDPIRSDAGLDRSGRTLGASA